MTKKEIFIKEIENANINLSEDAMIYFNALKGFEDKEKPKFTENGIKILTWMRENKNTYTNLFKAKDIAPNIDMTSRTVAGAARKLVTDGYLEKLGENPVVYALTDIGESVDLTN